MDNNTIHFRATPLNRGNDVVRLETRSRGGRVADIDADGTAAKQLMALFYAIGLSHAQPFFVLHRDRSGWLSIEHHPSETAPPKTVPHLRVWALLGDPVAPDLRFQHPTEFNLAVWGDARKMVMRANSVLLEYESSRKIGRPPRAIQQARDILASFSQLSGMVALANREHKPLTSHRRGVKLVERPVERPVEQQRDENLSPESMSDVMKLIAAHRQNNQIVA